jgi:AcrR family transcriptional regulator
MPPGQRAATTAATRRTIIDAARQLLATRDWSHFTLDAVAGLADVTRVTVYNQVGSKSGLLDAVLTELTERARMDQLLADTEAMAPPAARDFIVTRTCEFWHAERLVLRPLFGLAAVDQEISENLGRRERWRRAQLERLLDRLIEDGGDAEGKGRPGGFTRATVLAGLLAVTSFPTYDGLGPLADQPETAAAVIRHLAAGLTG